MRRSPLKDDLTALAWAVLLVNVIVLLSGALLAGYVGRPALLLAAAFAALITFALALVAGANLLVIGALRLRDRRRRTRALWSIASQ